MINGNAAIFLNMLSTMIISIFFIAAIISLCTPSVLSLTRNYSASWRRGTLWLVALSPWLISIIVAALLFNSARLLPQFSTVVNLFHWHHQDSFLLTSWHGVAGILTLTITTLMLYNNSARILVNYRKLTTLRELSERHSNGAFALDSELAAAFTAGLVNPQCFISTGLSQQLTAQEYKIVLLHEQAHASNYDPLKKWLFHLLTVFLPQGTSDALNQAMSVAIEQCADIKVAAVVKDRSLIALTLVKVGRIAHAQSNGFIDAEQQCNYGAESIQARVLYLLNPGQNSRTTAMLGVTALGFVTLFCAFAVDLIHHCIELLLVH